MPVILERLDDQWSHSHNEATETAVLTLDAAVVGTISRVADGLFKSHTKGLIPTIDNVTGSSVDDVWSKIVSLVSLGRVRFQKTVTETRYASKA